MPDTECPTCNETLCDDCFAKARTEYWQQLNPREVFGKDNGHLLECQCEGCRGLVEEARRLK
jgi:hypothetical protein